MCTSTRSSPRIVVLGPCVLGCIPPLWLAIPGYASKRSLELRALVSFPPCQVLFPGANWAFAFHTRYLGGFPRAHNYARNPPMFASPVFDHTVAVPLGLPFVHLASPRV